MSRISNDYQQSGPGTFRQAVWDLNVDRLKPLSQLLDSSVRLVRKGELTEFVMEQMSGPWLRRVWDRLDDAPKSAVAEAVHSWSGYFYADRFRAKYERDPQWETERNPSLLRLFFYHQKIPDDLGSLLKTLSSMNLIKSVLYGGDCGGIGGMSRRGLDRCRRVFPLHACCRP